MFYLFNVINSLAKLYCCINELIERVNNIVIAL